MLAGYETTNNMLSFCIYELSRRPDLQQRLQEEVDAVVARDHDPTLDDLAKIPLVDWVSRTKLYERSVQI